MSILIYGGSFDPFHLGHVHALSQVPSNYNFTDIVIVPTFQTPFKEKPEFTDQQRLTLIETILPELPKPNSNAMYHLDLFEINRGKQQFAIDTVTYIKDNYKNKKCYFLMGSDCFFQIQAWKNVEQLLDEISLIVVKRDDVDVALYNEHFSKHFSEQENSKLNVVGGSHKEISSTDIKRRFDNGTWTSLVPKSLIRPIKTFREVIA
jgi:nicotinate-nucleotide adenylyltransferase